MVALSAVCPRSPTTANEKGFGPTGPEVGSVVKDRTLLRVPVLESPTWHTMVELKEISRNSVWILQYLVQKERNTQTKH